MHDDPNRPNRGDAAMPANTDQPTLAVTQADRAVHVRENLDAYYYSFEATGDADIDRILGAVAYAGKAYHHTEDWDDESVIGVSCVGNIQNAANLAARHRTTHEPRPAGELREAHPVRYVEIEKGVFVAEADVADARAALATHSPAPMAGEVLPTDKWGETALDRMQDHAENGTMPPQFREDLRALLRLAAHPSTQEGGR